MRAKVSVEPADSRYTCGPAVGVWPPVLGAVAGERRDEPLRAGCLSEHEVRVGADQPVGGHRRQPSPLGDRPLPQGGGNEQPGLLTSADLPVPRLEIQVRRDRPVPQCLDGLDRAGYTRDRLGMPDIGLDRTQRTSTLADPVHRVQRLELHRVTDCGTRPVGLHQTHRTGIDARARHHLPEQLLLQRGGRRGQPAGPTVVVRPRSPDHRQYPITITGPRRSSPNATRPAAPAWKLPNRYRESSAS